MAGFPDFLSCDTYVIAVVAVSATVAVVLWDKRLARAGEGAPLLEITSIG